MKESEKVIVITEKTVQDQEESMVISVIYD
jgi:hypothetical protein